MNTKLFSEAMNEVNDRYYEEAANYQVKKKKNGWLKWGAMAACLCLVVVGALFITNEQSDPQGNSDFTAPYYSLSETEHLCVEVVEVGFYTYKAKVVDTGNNSIYPLGTEVGVNVNFGYTEILMSDGTFFNDGVDDTSLRLENIGWDVGSILYVEFEAYTETNKYPNLLFASHIRQADE